jgi:hypothetical protein
VRRARKSTSPVVSPLSFVEVTSAAAVAEAF